MYGTPKSFNDVKDVVGQIELNEKAFFADRAKWFPGLESNRQEDFFIDFDQFSNPKSDLSEIKMGMFSAEEDSMLKNIQDPPKRNQKPSKIKKKKKTKSLELSEEIFKPENLFKETNNRFQYFRRIFTHFSVNNHLKVKHRLNESTSMIQFGDFNVDSNCSNLSLSPN